MEEKEEKEEATDTRARAYTSGSRCRSKRTQAREQADETRRNSQRHFSVGCKKTFNFHLTVVSW